MTSATHTHQAKRPRLGDGPIVDSPDNDKAMVNTPELDHIRQSNSQLAFLQAQLAATEALYSAYEAELDGLSQHFAAVKRSHLQSGQPLWKDPQFAIDDSLRQRWLARVASQPDDGGPDTFSDLEEEVLLLPPGPGAPDASASSRDAGPASASGAAATTAAAAAQAPEDQQLPIAEQRQQQQWTGDRERDGEGPGRGPGQGDAPEGLQAGARAGEQGGTGGPGSRQEEEDGGGWCLSGPARARLEALEATCSAVAQEDMEAQGAVACLVGRTARYYLRGITVSLGRGTDTKGDVDVDLGPEEEEAGAGGAAGRAERQQQQEGAVGGEAEAGAGASSTGGEGGGGGSGHRVSRRQALIRLGPDGQFRLTNMGRQTVRVNDVPVEQHLTVSLPHLSLTEVGGVALLFLANMAAVARVVVRSGALVL